MVQYAESKVLCSANNYSTLKSHHQAAVLQFIKLFISYMQCVHSMKEALYGMVFSWNYIFSYMLYQWHYLWIVTSQLKGSPAIGGNCSRTIFLWSQTNFKNVRSMFQAKLSGFEVYITQEMNVHVQASWHEYIYIYILL